MSPTHEAEARRAHADRLLTVGSSMQPNTSRDLALAERHSSSRHTDYRSECHGADNRSVIRKAARIFMANPFLNDAGSASLSGLRW
jgi:hypothetical protein